MKRKAIVVVLTLALAGATLLIVQMRRHGFSAREDPSWLEAAIARRLRNFAIPASAKKMTNPYPFTDARWRSARDHFIAHCAVCHGPDGRGDTPIGRNLYPKVPDLTGAETQQLTDGELYYIISNGVRFTGMPAWGDEDRPESIWELVAFIRRLPHLSSEEREQMEKLFEGRKHGEEGETIETHTHGPEAEPHQH